MPLEHDPFAPLDNEGHEVIAQKPLAQETPTTEVFTGAAPAMPPTMRELPEPDTPEELKPIASIRKPKATTNGILAMAGVGVICLLLVLFLTSSPKKTQPATTAKAGPTKVLPPKQDDETLPQNKVKSDPALADDSVTPAAILRTKTQSTGPHIDSGATKSFTLGDSSNVAAEHANGAALSNVAAYPGFPGSNGNHWEPAPYGAGANPPSQYGNFGNYASTGGAPGKGPSPSLVFTRKGTEMDRISNATTFPVVKTSNLGLGVGYKVAVRLESVASTALTAPVIAVVEYDATKDGQTVIPAGARLVGVITDADRNGTIGIRFNRLILKDGSSYTVAAVGMDKNLNALKGDVTGKNTGKKIMIGLASGLGTVGSVVVGGNNLSAPYSEGDQIRQQVGQNVATSGNNAISGLNQTERVVVSLPAGTELYAEFVDGTGKQ